MSARSLRIISINEEELLLNQQDRDTVDQTIIKEKRILYVVLSLISVTLLVLFIVVLSAILIPSIDNGKSIILGNCTVLENTYTSVLCGGDDDCTEYNTNLWWYELFEKDYGDNAERMFINSVSYGAPNTEYSGPNIPSNPGNNDSSVDLCHNCYSGRNIVAITHRGQTYNSTVDGLYSDNFDWVKGYVANYPVGESFPCYYDTRNLQHIIWFVAPSYSMMAAVSVIISGVLFFIVGAVFAFFIFMCERGKIIVRYNASGTTSTKMRYTCI
ncbi:hypothetical protein SAMD00019534_039360 [Acytostelium subglobosum LB1]|uniref:hypothetical protein n=1 Tax=Acytostelium subglobosum LB1 TaxID=1410327 RepID=UPI000644C984|nr:hypothetical protein SAMD00019534_039360 [Acytostelium subglobosum LB1]GAM20761.1 hypothetical protein SAMD00019534_039360 [Acytostelium subglobosum LB1]|eukprot:XP_012755895.1 hypothetical protein SAMD00019534_039360 [Acytostelium subglobosum LB1]